MHVSARAGGVTAMLVHSAKERKTRDLNELIIDLFISIRSAANRWNTRNGLDRRMF